MERITHTHTKKKRHPEVSTQDIQGDRITYTHPLRLLTFLSDSFILF